MLAKIDQLKWTSSSGSHRDLAFLIVILAFGIILTIKLAPYYRKQETNIVYNRVETTPSVPKTFLEKIALPIIGTGNPAGGSASTRPRSQAIGGSAGTNRPSVLERPLFDGQTVVLRVRSQNAYSSNDSGQPIEVRILGPLNQRDGEIDYSPVINGRLLGTGTPNIQSKRLYIAFSELVSAEGRSYRIEGQAIGSENLTSGIEGDYSSGLPSRLLGIAIDRTIMAADQIGTAYLFSGLGPAGAGAQELRNTAMQVSQQASQNIAAEATKDLRDTPPEIKLPSGSVFLVRIRAAQMGIRP